MFARRASSSHYGSEHEVHDSSTPWRRALAAALAGATALAGVLSAGAPARAQDDDGITVYLASDSTVQTYDPYYEPQAGWGQVIDRYFDEDVTIANHAIGGRSSRSFIEQGRLDAILDVIQPGDYLFVQFGHNDATVSVPERYTSPDDYKMYLRDYYIAGAIEKGAIPVLVTPVSRRSFDAATGEFNVSFPEYVAKVHELHEETGVAVVDLSASSRAYLNEIGPEEAESVFLHVPAGVYPNRPNGTTDDTHFQEYGAIQMARLVAEETATLGLPLSEHVVDVAPPDAVPAAPTGVVAATVANASITLNWADQDDADVYRVYVREPGSEWRLGTTATVGVGRVSGLEEDTAYEFAVAAVNGRGESAYSDVLAATTATAGFKYDFGPASQTVAPGYTEVNRGTVYDATKGYGFTTDMTSAIDRDRGVATDPLGSDFVAWFGGSYDFAVDVADGLYTARVVTGDYLGSARTNLKFEGVDYGAANAGSKSILTKDFEGIVVEDGQLNVNVSGQTGHLNGLELTRIGDVPGSGGEGPDEPCADCAAQIEDLGRAPVAVAAEDGNYLSWRSLATDPEGLAFNVYRDGRLITAEPTGLTNLTDQGGTANATYWIATVEDGVETGYTAEFGVWGDQYVDVDMQRPAGGTTPDGVAYEYRPNDATVADLDGDGTYELIQKWDPTNAKDNSQSGYTGNVYVDAYTLDGELLWRIDLGVNIRAGAHYTFLMAYDLDGDGKAEVALKTADGTVDGTGAVIGDADADYRNSGGYVLSGPEFLTVFDGRTGAAVQSVDFQPDRGNVTDWGDGYGNRVDRIMAAVAYLDGSTPSLVTTRGIYTKMELTAWDWDGSQLEQRWAFRSQDWGAQYSGQGNHNLSVADVDADGRDEIVYGSLTLNDDGTILQSAGLGHGDALHVSDFDPSREGLEVFSPFESMSASGNRAAAFRDAETGEVLWDVPGVRDTGRGTCGDIDPAYPGAECWAVSATGAWNSREGSCAPPTGRSSGRPSRQRTRWSGGTATWAARSSTMSSTSPRTRRCTRTSPNGTPRRARRRRSSLPKGCRRTTGPRATRSSPATCSATGARRSCSARSRTTGCGSSPRRSRPSTRSRRSCRTRSTASASPGRTSRTTSRRGRASSSASAWRSRSGARSPLSPPATPPPRRTRRARARWTTGSRPTGAPASSSRSRSPTPVTPRSTSGTCAGGPAGWRRSNTTGAARSRSTGTPWPPTRRSGTSRSSPATRSRSASRAPATRTTRGCS
nr:hypothetical protein GCM10025732_14980 [Glycomyces mayteni]